VKKEISKNGKHVRQGAKTRKRVWPRKKQRRISSEGTARGRGSIRKARLARKAATVDGREKGNKSPKGSLLYLWDERKGSLERTEVKKKVGFSGERTPFDSEKGKSKLITGEDRLEGEGERLGAGRKNQELKGRVRFSRKKAVGSSSAVKRRR